MFSNTFASLGSAVHPAISSLALCLLQARAKLEGKDDVDVGNLFGALAVVQALGQMLLGPLVFGTIYSQTVAFYPKTIFVVGATLAGISSTSMLMVRVPGSTKKIAQSNRRDVERGRSRVSKDLRKPRGSR